MVNSLELPFFLSKCIFRSDFVLFVCFFPEMNLFWMHAFTACLYETFKLSESFISFTIIANAIVMVHFLVALDKAQPNTLAKWSAIHSKFGNVTLHTSLLLWSNELALAVASTSKFSPTTVLSVSNDEQLANLSGKFCSLKLNASHSKPS